jgi:hypothetical protein
VVCRKLDVERDTLGAPITDVFVASKAQLISEPASIRAPVLRSRNDTDGSQLVRTQYELSKWVDLRSLGIWVLRSFESSYDPSTESKVRFLIGLIS